jgi:hypothetical protein
MEQLRSDIEGLFGAFLPEDLASRWARLASRTPSHWHKIDPWKVWKHFDPLFMDEWQGKFDQGTKQVVWDERIKPYQNSKVVVFACGHSKPALFEAELISTMGVSSPHSFLEGFVSIVPKKLGLVCNHDGEIIVLQRRA